MINSLSGLIELNIIQKYFEGEIEVHDEQEVLFSLVCWRWFKMISQIYSRRKMIELVETVTKGHDEDDEIDYNSKQFTITSLSQALKSKYNLLQFVSKLRITYNSLSMDMVNQEFGDQIIDFSRNLVELYGGSDNQSYCCLLQDTNLAPLFKSSESIQAVEIQYFVEIDDEQLNSLLELLKSRCRGLRKIKFSKFSYQLSDANIQRVTGSIVSLFQDTLETSKIWYFWIQI